MKTTVRRLQTALFMVLPVLLLSGCATLSGRKQAAREAVPASAGEIRPLLVGAKVPELILRMETAYGETINLNDLLQKKPTVLIFYRGGWCIYCNRQLSRLRQVEPELLSLGFNLIAISPDRPEKLRESIEKHKLHYMLLSDSDMDAARAFGVAFRVAPMILKKYREFNIDLEAASGRRHHLLPVPSVFIIGTDGRIKYEYVNPDYQVRIDPEVLLAMARSLKKK